MLAENPPAFGHPLFKGGFARTYSEGHVLELIKEEGSICSLYYDFTCDHEFNLNPIILQTTIS